MVTKAQAISTNIQFQREKNKITHRECAFFECCLFIDVRFKKKFGLFYLLYPSENYIAVPRNFLFRLNCPFFAV